MTQSQSATENFIESVYEIAFGDNAINRDFTEKEVIDKIREFSDNALLWEEGQDDKNFNN